MGDYRAPKLLVTDRAWPLPRCAHITEGDDEVVGDRRSVWERELQLQLWRWVGWVHSLGRARTWGRGAWLMGVLRADG